MGRFTTSDAVSLAYEDAGTGLPVLCLPGLTRNARDFDDLAPHLTDVRLIRLTSRGRDPSDWAADHTTYSVPVEARDVVELLDHLGIARTVVIGTSRGGLIAMVLAAAARDRLAGVLLNDIGPEISATGLERIMGYLGRRPGGRNLGDVAEALAANMGGEFPDFDSAMWRKLAGRWFAQGEDGIALRYDPRLRDAVLEGATTPAPDMWPLFDALAGLPLAVLRGGNSDLLTAGTLAAMQARRPDMLAATVPDRGHVPLLDEPQSLAVIRALLDRARDVV